MAAHQCDPTVNAGSLCSGRHSCRSAGAWRGERLGFLSLADLSCIHLPNQWYVDKHQIYSWLNIGVCLDPDIPLQASELTMTLGLERYRDLSLMPAIVCRNVFICRLFLYLEELLQIAAHIQRVSLICDAACELFIPRRIYGSGDSGYISRSRSRGRSGCASMDRVGGW